MSNLNLNTVQQEEYGIRSIYANKNFMLLTSGRFISMLGDAIHMNSMILYIIAIIGTGTAVGTIMTIAYLPSIFLGPFMGVLADRYDRRIIMILMDAIRGVIAISLGYLVYMNMAPLWVLCVGTALLAACGTLYFPASGALFPNLVHNSQLVKANSLNTLTGSLSGLIGPFLAVAVYSSFGAAGAFAVNGLTFMMSAICEVFMRTPKIVNKSGYTVKDFASNFVGGFKFVFHTKALLAMLLFGLTVNFFFFPIQDVVQPMIIKKVLLLSDDSYKIIIPFFTAGFGLSALIIQLLPKMEKKHRFMIWSMFAQAMGLILLAVPIFPGFINRFNAQEFVVIYCIILMLRGLAFGFSNVPMAVVYQMLIPDEYRGKVYALQGTFFQAAKPFGIMLIGMMIDRYPTYIITSIAGIGMAIACFIMFTVKEIKEI